MQTGMQTVSPESSQPWAGASVAWKHCPGLRPDLTAVPTTQGEGSLLLLLSISPQGISTLGGVFSEGLSSPRSGTCGLGGQTAGLRPPCLASFQGWCLPPTAELLGA